MSSPSAASAPEPVPQHLADNVMHFGRVLRQAGLPVGSDRIALTLRALNEAGLHSRTEFHAVLAACLLDRHEHQALFDQAFALFWLSGAGRQDLALPLLLSRSSPAQASALESRRLADALWPARLEDRPPEPPDDGPWDAFGPRAASAFERLHRTDFESMSPQEFAQARRLLAQLPSAFAPVPTRRRAPAARPGRPDLRATLRAAARQGGEAVALRWTAPREVVPPLVVLADISGSMARYSRMLLHFAHLLGQRRGPAMPRVECFVFGTRLTRITPWLRQRDPDLAVARVSAGVPDWSGGTRISESLAEFNRRWARRVLGSRATVLLVTDGLEHGPTEDLAFEMERLHKSCRRLLWLNPLLRFQRFEPRAAGIRAMLPQVDAFLPAHNLDSLAQLVGLLRDQNSRSARKASARP